ncbi:MAG: EAL domain-containing protein [Peptostreptococcaceae bacterium]|jgi:diguanylate cyclase (GGDEF)-like protein|nr:EAL domain-containing protein [Peptostreptococcaceae bacterium]
MKKKLMLYLAFSIILSNIILGFSIENYVQTRIDKMFLNNEILVQNKIDILNFSKGGLGNLINPYKYKDYEENIINLKQDIYIYSTFIIAFVTIVTAMISTKLFNKTIVSRIKKIHRSLSYIKEGFYNHDVILCGDDEIAKISKDINSMKEIISDREELLKKKNEQIKETLIELKEEKERVEFLAFYDQLTKLPNRYNFLENSEKFLKNLKPKFAVIHIDVDDFKKINDLFSALEGDRYLRDLSSKLKKFFKKENYIFRIGGDEFCILYKFTDENQLYIELNRLFKYINQTYKIKNKELDMSTSIGVSVYPKDSKDFHQIARNSHIALNEAKRKGKRQIIYYSDYLKEDLKTKSKIEQDMKLALENEEFYLLYQPKVSIFDKKIKGVEALIRWNKNGKNIYPSEFIPIAESSGLIIDIEKYVLKKALMDFSKMKDFGFKDVELSVNISAEHFNSKDFLCDIKKIVKENKDISTNLEFEITENIFLGNIDEANNKLMELKNNEINIALDDFGTGYSSLSYLKNLKIDTLKIDKSFVDDIQINKKSESIIKLVLDLAEGLGLEIVVEGVEKKEQLDVFDGRKKDFLIQGYYFYKPIEFPRLKEVLNFDSKIEDKTFFA